MVSAINVACFFFLFCFVATNQFGEASCQFCHGPGENVSAAGKLFCSGFFMIQHQFLMWFLKIQDHHLNWLFIWLRQHKYILNPCSGPRNCRHMQPSGSGKSSWLLVLEHPAPFAASLEEQIFLLFWKNNQQLSLCSWNNSTPGCDGVKKNAVILGRGFVLFIV